jgi:hypothetical protein
MDRRVDICANKNINLYSNIIKIHNYNPIPICILQIHETHNNDQKLMVGRCGFNYSRITPHLL